MALQRMAKPATSTNPPTAEPLFVPHSVQAEEALLGALLIEPAGLARARAVVQADDFFILRHAWLYEALERLYLRGDIIDTLAVSEELRTQGRLEDTGGSGFLYYLINNTPHALHTEIYAQIVYRLAMRRRLLEAAGEIADLALAEDHALPEILEGAAQRVGTVVQRHLGRALRRHSEVADAYYETLAAVVDEGRVLPVISTGLLDLDQKLGGGLRPGHLYTIGGPTGGGKSTLMYNLAVHAATHGQTVLVVSLEMSGLELFQRLLASRTGVDTVKIAQLQNLTASEVDALINVQHAVRQPQIIYDEQSRTLEQIRATTEKLQGQGAVDLVVIDYAQLVEDESGGEKRHRLDAIARKAKLLALDLQIPVVLGTQLNEDGDPFESKAVKHHSDVFIVIEPVHLGEGDTTKPGKCFLALRKHRMGPTGRVAVYYHPGRLQFGNLQQRA